MCIVGTRDAIEESRKSLQRKDLATRPPRGRKSLIINDLGLVKFKVDARGGIEPPIQLLQSRALPLGHPARLLNYDSLLLQSILDRPPSKCVLFTFCPKIFTFLLQKRLYPSLNVEAKPERYSLL